MLPDPVLGVAVGDALCVAVGDAGTVPVVVAVAVLIGVVRVTVAVAVVRVEVGVWVRVAVGVSLAWSAGVADGVTPTGVTVNGVVVSVAVGGVVVVGVSVAVGDAPGVVRIFTMAVASAMLTRPSPLTSAPSHVLGPPNTMSSTAEMSAWSTCPSQLASPWSGTAGCATLTIAENPENPISSSIPQRHRMG